MKDRDLDRKDDRIDLEDPLGIADEPIARSPADHLNDNESEDMQRRRRMRALGEDGMESSTAKSRRDDHGGASSVDMGYGGEGTDVKPSK